MTDAGEQQLIIPDELVDKTIRYRDRYGNLQELRVSKLVARAYNTIVKNYYNAEKRWERRHIAFRDIGAEDAKPLDVAEDSPDLPINRRKLRSGASQWEGPRLRFDRLLGESTVWDGPPGRDAKRRCEFCHSAPLEPHEYCLGCDKCGRDYMVRKPTRAEMAKRADKKAPPPDEEPVTLTAKGKAKRKAKGLRGGVGSTDRRKRKVRA